MITHVRHCMIIEKGLVELYCHIIGICPSKSNYRKARRIPRQGTTLSSSGYAPGVEVLSFFTIEVASLDERVLPLVLLLSLLFCSAGEKTYRFFPPPFSIRIRMELIMGGGGGKRFYISAGKTYVQGKGAEIRHPLGKTVKNSPASNFFCQTTSTLIEIDTLWFKLLFESIQT